jgi:hypothetical protein
VVHNFPGPVSTYVFHLSVPAMVADLLESSLVGYPIETLLFGGSPAPLALIPRAQNVFPTTNMLVSGVLQFYYILRGQFKGVRLTG